MPSVPHGKEERGGAGGEEEEGKEEPEIAGPGQRVR